MDEDAHPAFRDPMICVTGVAHEEAACDSTRFLKVKKSRKFMGIQDDLAVVCAGRALESAGLSTASLGERTGLYLAVGYIPFQEPDIGPVLDASMEDGRFSMRRFAEGGYQKAHPLLTFKCLPNMPAYHVSFNFDIQGPYIVTYPGPGQLYTALEEAVYALREGRVDVALVGGVAHQRNFLVEHHFRRIEPPVAAERLRDAGGMVVLETEEHARARGAVPLGRLESMTLGYEPFNPTEPKRPKELAGVSQSDLTTARILRLSGDDTSPELGPGSLPIVLSMAWGPRKLGRYVHHELAARDGIRGESDWVGAEPVAPAAEVSR